MKKTTATLLLILLLGIFWISSLRNKADLAAAIQNIPPITKFQVTLAVAELKPDDAVLEGHNFKSILADLKLRSGLGLALLDEKSGAEWLLHSKTTKVLKQGESFSISYVLPKEKDTGTGPNPYLRNISATVKLVSVDTSGYAEVNVTGPFQWYADLMKTNHSANFGGSIPGSSWLNLGTAVMTPLFVQPEGSAWIVVTVAKAAN